VDQAVAVDLGTVALQTEPTLEMLGEGQHLISKPLPMQYLMETLVAMVMRPIQVAVAVELVLQVKTHRNKVDVVVMEVQVVNFQLQELQYFTQVAEEALHRILDLDLVELVAEETVKVPMLQTKKSCVAQMA
jgi:hypothetical protein